MFVENREYDIYKDIECRCKGEIYIGVVGPVRTGKSTFVKHFMEKMVLPNIEDEFERQRAIDELPQSANGKTITTTEPKFIPANGAIIKVFEDINLKVRLIDCVGYMVDGAVGHMEEDKERMVKTPWSDTEIPFSMAAKVGTDKCINDHSTIGLVITTDGSIGEIDGAKYEVAEENTINTLKETGKPFIVVINTTNPESSDALAKKQYLEEKFNVTCILLDCEKLSINDIKNIFECILYEFPISCISFDMPGWMKTLEKDNPIKQGLIEEAGELMKQVSTMKDIYQRDLSFLDEYFDEVKLSEMSLENGNVTVSLKPIDNLYYDYISNVYGSQIEDEQSLIAVLKEYAACKDEYKKIKEALTYVKAKGYGVILPDKDEIVLNEPEIIKHGNRYGVKIKALSPSIHMIKADIETEIAPIVGSKQQAEDLIEFLKAEDEKKEIWETNIFGKSVEQMVQDGINTKILGIGDECQLKLKDTMQKIVNDMDGGIICIII